MQWRVTNYFKRNKSKGTSFERDVFPGNKINQKRTNRTKNLDS